MHECLQLLIKKFRHLQHQLNEKFWIDKFIHNKLITVCQRMSACQYVCFKFFDTLVDLINDLQSFIIIFNKSHSHQIENYQQPKIVYYIDRRYRISYFKKQFQLRFWSRLKSSLNESRTLYNRRKNDFDQNQTIVLYNSRQYDREKKCCFICNRIDCWSINHTRKKRDASKTRLKKRFNELFSKSNYQSKKNWNKQMFQYMIDYICSHEGINSDAEFVDELKAFTMKINVINDFKNIIFSKSFVFIRQNFYYFESKNQMNWKNQKI